ncbi:MAG: YraN family protein [Gammaproteobacteria bacterium]|nr:YraN family protein [Gammaproteobacteria bacterium]
MQQRKGDQAEDVVKNYLLSQGLQWEMSHYRSRFGEIDLVMRDKAWLVFVEVRFRQSRSFGNALESVTPQKQKKLWLTASCYLSERRAHLSENVRFDVVSLQGDVDEIEWIRDAFRL